MLINQQEQPPITYDLAIVGGGIVGTTLACALKNSGLKIVIIETQLPEVAAARRQGYAISLLSGLIFQGIGVWSEILPQINTFHKIRLSDGDYREVVEFLPSDLPQANHNLDGSVNQGLGYVGEHRPIHTALQNFIANSPNISWLCPAEVSQVNYQDNQVEIAVKMLGNQANQAEAKIYTKLLVAADGSRSSLRQGAGITTHGWKYWQSCIAMTIKTEIPHNNVAFERFWSSGPMGILPLPGGNRCQVVWTAPHAQAKQLKEIDEEEFLGLLFKRTGGILGQVELESDRYLFPVQLMQSDRYINHRLALVGDAAHCCHPVGGQGLNLGIRDAAAMAEILQDAHKNGEDLGSLDVLKRYENWRKKENLAILGFTDFLDRTFSNNFLPIVTIRRIGLWCLKNIPLVKSLSLQLMTGLLGKQPKIIQGDG